MFKTLFKTYAFTVLLALALEVTLGIHNTILDSLAYKAAMNDNYLKTPGLPAYAPIPNQEGKDSPIVHLALGRGNSCTGFVIDGNYIVTAAHCIHDSKNVTVQNEGRTLKTPIPAKVVGYNMRVDYGLLKGDFRGFNSVPIAPNKALSQLLVGHQVVACGFPEGQTTTVCTPALIISPMNFKMLARGDVYPGMSGGPVVEPQSGLVIGVNHAGVGDERIPDGILIAPLTGFLGAMGIENESKG